MVSPKRQIVIPMPRPQLVSPPISGCEQPRAFRFSVTWQTLLAQLQPLELTRTQQPPAASMEIVPLDAPARALQVVEPPPLDLEEDVPAWEMVVPKMTRRPS